MSLDQVTNAIHARLPDFNGLGARVMFDFGDDGTICIDAKATPPVVCAADGDMDCRIRLSIADMGKLMAGNLNPALHARQAEGRRLPRHRHEAGGPAG